MSFYIYTGEGSSLCKPDLNGSQSRVFTNTLDSLAFTLFLPATVNLNWIPQLLSDPNTSASFSCHLLPRMPGKICPIFHPHPRPCCSQLVFLMEKEKSKESRSLVSSPLLIGQKGFQKRELNKTHPGVLLPSLKFILCTPPNTTTIILGSNVYPITRSNMPLLHLCS